MQNYRKTSHSIFDIKYHLAWITKYRYPVLKGKSSRKLLQEFSELRKQYWGQHLWARGFFCVSSGNVTDEMWKEYIENQRLETKEDNFDIAS